MEITPEFLNAWTSTCFPSSAASANGYCQIVLNSSDFLCHSSWLCGRTMHSSFNSSHKAWQTDGMILLKVGFGILKMSSSTENDAGPLKYRRVAWRRSRAGTAERISVSCFEIRGETLKYVNYLISLSPSMRLSVKKMYATNWWIKSQTCFSTLYIAGNIFSLLCTKASWKFISWLCQELFIVLRPYYQSIYRRKVWAWARFWGLWCQWYCQLFVKYQQLHIISSSMLLFLKWKVYLRSSFSKSSGNIRKSMKNLLRSSL